MWLPAVLAFATCVVFVMGDGLVAILDNWEKPGTGLGWVGAGAAGHCALAGLAVVLLVAGVRNPRSREAIAAVTWLIIPAGLGWLMLTARLGSPV